MSSNLSLQHFIRTYHINISQDILNNIDNFHFKPTYISGPRENEEILDVNYRYCYGYTVNPKYDSTISKIIWNTIDTLLKQYTNDVTMETGITSNIEGYTILKYTEGCFYKQHFDSGVKNHRSLSIILLLNDDYEGGELSFFNDTYSIKPKKNLAIIFPSTFMFPHQVKPIIKGTRYSIVTWVV